MSEETFTALEAAIADHVATIYEGAIVTGWTLCATYTRADEGDGDFTDEMVVIKPPRQPVHSTAGMLHVGLGWATHSEMEDTDE